MTPEAMPPEELCRVIDMALAGKWEEAHRRVQASENDPAACWIHAVLHKIEGDAANARFWYRRAEKLDQADRDPTEELTAIRQSLTPR
jgi:hypothetical protein